MVQTRSGAWRSASRELAYRRSQSPLIRGSLASVSTDTKWILGAVGGATIAIITVVLAIAGLMLASLNQRIDDGFASVNQRIDDVRADLTAQIDGVHTRLDDVRRELKQEIAVLRADLRGVDDRLRAVELALARLEPSVLPASEPPADMGGAAPPEPSSP